MLSQPAKLPPFQIDRKSMREHVAKFLRDLIVQGILKPGAKITEREVASLLFISRMPARDALLDLERQGLIEHKPGGRYVIQLSEADIRRLYELRLALEQLAVELAIQKGADESLAGLGDTLEEMRSAVAAGDSDRYIAGDLEFHTRLWQASGNPYLVRMLESMLGPISMFISTQAGFPENWSQTLDLHATLAEAIARHDLAQAMKIIADHMAISLDLALKLNRG